MLSKKHDVILVGRENHVEEINKKGLRISGETDYVAHPDAITFLEKQDADLVILTVKAYDTRQAVEEIVGKCDSPILSLQNGIGNEEIISEIAGRERTIGGITTHGVRYVSPGNIIHTGKGETIIGEMDGSLTRRVGSISERVKNFADAMTECGIETKVSRNIRREIWRKAIVNASINPLNIRREIWRKAIVNASINPLTAVLRCKNGYLLENKHAMSLMKKICMEASMAAKSNGIDVGNVMKKVEEVAYMTKENYSSMLQSVIMGKKTEIDYINGEILKIGMKKGIEMPANSFLIELVKAMENAAVAP